MFVLSAAASKRCLDPDVKAVMENPDFSLNNYHTEKHNGISQ